MDTLTLEVTEGIATVTVDRPEALNALDQRVIGELVRCFDALRINDQVAAVIVTGAGPKAFVAGADIRELATLDVAGAKQTAERGQACFRAIERFPKPVIAAVNGFALGGGCELALACHIRIASDRARFGLPEVTLGLIPGFGGTQRLARLVGKGVALELILSGEMIDADSAAAIGLANRVVPADELTGSARGLAQIIASRGPLAVRYAIEAVHAGLDMGQDDGERLEAALFAALAASEDTREGLTAFLEKRKPAFKGR